jgi:hypothetical protein
MAEMVYSTNSLNIMKFELIIWEIQSINPINKAEFILSIENRRRKVGDNRTSSKT